jgi:hypothetical protein
VYVQATASVQVSPVNRQDDFQFLQSVWLVGVGVILAQVLDSHLGNVAEHSLPLAFLSTLH